MWMIIRISDVKIIWSVRCRYIWWIIIL